MAALDPEYKAFVVHMATLNVGLGDEIHLSRIMQIAHLKADKALTEMLHDTLILQMSYYQNEPWSFQNTELVIMPSS